MKPIEMMAISEVRSVATRVLLEERVAYDTEEAARGAIQAACDEAANFNISPADVIRAILRPVFRTSDGCDCPSCKSGEERLSEDVGLPSGTRS